MSENPEVVKTPEEIEAEIAVLQAEEAALKAAAVASPDAAHRENHAAWVPASETEESYKLRTSHKSN